jgi:hypothetical protein
MNKSLPLKIKLKKGTKNNHKQTEQDKNRSLFANLWD